MEPLLVQHVANEKNSIPLTQLVLEKHAYEKGGQTLIKDYKLLKEKTKQVNLNAMPVKG